MATKEEVIEYMRGMTEKFLIIEYVVLIVILVVSHYLVDMFNNDMIPLLIMLGFIALFFMNAILDYWILKAMETALRTNYRLDRMIKQYNEDIKRIDDLFFDFDYRIKKLEKEAKQQ